VLQELGDRDLDLLWVGGEGGMEADLVARAGLQMRSLPAAGLHGVGIAALPGNALQLFRGYFAARRLLREFKPDVLFFTGGYVAAPVAMAAGNTPTLAFVPDIQPGFTLRFIARFADVITVVAEEARQYFQRPERVQVTGYPIRKEVSAWTREKAIQHFGLRADLPTLLVFGGSKGARSINTALLAALPEVLQDMQVLHVSGTANWTEVESAKATLPADLAARYFAFPYLHGDMGAALVAADLLVCRAGASTLGESPLFGLPTVLVPIPLKNHLQTVNAAYLQSRGAAVILPDADMPAKLANTVRALIQDKPRLRAMSASMRALAAPNAAKQIASLLRELDARTAAARGEA
jgi:UDP-N-acetylglucosamine--N-acetylmuramyl-(pentapeptide) pyrophosphoryl-undecaprenol N-acetylglucosamine transferase